MPDTAIITAKYRFFYSFTVKSCSDQVACAFERPAEDLDLLHYVFLFHLYTMITMITVAIAINSPLLLILKKTVLLLLKRICCNTKTGFNNTVQKFFRIYRYIYSAIIFYQIYIQIIFPFRFFPWFLFERNHFISFARHKIYVLSLFSIYLCQHKYLGYDQQHTSA